MPFATVESSPAKFQSKEPSKDILYHSILTLPPLDITQKNSQYHLGNTSFQGKPLMLKHDDSIFDEIKKEVENPLEHDASWQAKSKSTMPFTSRNQL
jgi:hypothetical protein